MKTWNRRTFVFAMVFGAVGLTQLWAADDAQAQRRRGRRRRSRPEPEPAPAAPSPPAGAPSGFRGPTRIDFDDRLIQGQTNKSGAVYLFSRKETNISSMVRRRKSFRHLTIRTVYDR